VTTRGTTHAPFSSSSLTTDPDKHPRNPKEQEIAAEKFKEIAEAFEILGDCDTRRGYDIERRIGKADSAPTKTPVARTSPYRRPDDGRSFRSTVKIFHLPLRHACLWGDTGALRSILESATSNTAAFLRSASIDRTSRETALHLAARRGHVECVRLLVRAGASVLARNDEFRTPLHCASERGLTEVARALLDSSARGQLDARDARGRRAVDIAAAWGYETTARFLSNRKA